MTFDKKTIRILKYIRKIKISGVTWSKIQLKFGEDEANIFLLEALNKDLYLVTKDINGQWIDFSQPQLNLDSGFVSYTTPKANEMIEQMSFNFWKWMIPTLISAAALLLSIVALSE